MAGLLIVLLNNPGNGTMVCAAWLNLSLFISIIGKDILDWFNSRLPTPDS